MSNYSNETLTALLKELKEEIEQGFTGVHKRQDHTNGCISENRSEINKLKVWRGFMTGGITIIAFLLGFFFKLIEHLL